MRFSLDALGHDLRHAIRRLTRAPGLSLIVIATLALSIAANTTIFSLLKATVLRALPVPEPQALVSIGATDVRTGGYSSIHLATFHALRAEQQSFSELSAFLSSLLRVEFDASSFDIGVAGVTPEFFAALRTGAKAGRLLSPDDDPFAPFVVISERLSARLFGESNPVGRLIAADGRQLEVIGVLANGFTGVRMDGGDDLFLSLPLLRAIGTGDPKGIVRAQMFIGRLASGVTLDAARAEVLGRWPAIQTAVGSGLPPVQKAAIDNQRLTVTSFAGGFSSLRDRYGQSLQLVMWLAVALLAVGGINLSGLMLARALTRQHEFAVRIALGVSRMRLVQQTLVDGVLLSMAALVAAIPLSFWASAVLTSMVSVARAVPLEDTAPDGQVLAIATVAALVTGVLIGVLPARRAIAKSSNDDMLRGRGTAQRIRGASRVLLMTQVAASMVLVVGAGLFVTTLSNLYANDLRDKADPVLFTRISRNPLERNTLLRQPYFQTLQEQLAAIPGADAAAYSGAYPGYMGFFNGMPTEMVSMVEAGQAPAITDYVSPGFFELYSIARLRGRDFTWSDNDDTAPKVAIVNETLARKLTPSGEVVGRRIQVASGPVKTDLEIVGVVADANVASIRERNLAGLYRPLMHDIRQAQTPMVHVRVTGDTASVQRAYVDVVNAQGQHFVRAIFTMDGWIENAVVEQRLIAGMASFAATLAMALASVGLFGLLAYSVSSRTREIGVRVSVGATQNEVVRMIVREGLVVAIPGVAIGIPLALAAAWVVRSQLYGVTATDPRTLAGASVLFIVTAAVASWLPARRAARIQPIDALRTE